MTVSTDIRRRSFRSAVNLRSGHSIYWWAEIGCIFGFYTIYSGIRNAVQANPSAALAHAKQVIRFERAIGLYHEQQWNQWARGIRVLIIACNYFYGSLHFFVTIGIGIFLFRYRPDDYPRWRNTLAIATGLALIGFWTYQLMPPRLLDPSYGFVDTLAHYGTPWNWKSSAVNKLSNQYAAMPSVHCAWALWCASALRPQLRQRWAKILIAIYPATTVTVIVFTANHYFVDAIAGFSVLAIGYFVAKRLTKAGRVSDQRTPRPALR